MNDHGIGEDVEGYFCAICGFDHEADKCPGKCPDIEGHLEMIWHVLDEAVTREKVGPWNKETMVRLRDMLSSYLKLRSGKWRLDSYFRSRSI